MFRVSLMLSLLLVGCARDEATRLADMRANEAMSHDYYQERDAFNHPVSSHPGKMKHEHHAPSIQDAIKKFFHHG